MSTSLDEKVGISLLKGDLLVLFEYLARSYDVWHETGESRKEDTFALQQPDPGERRALWHLEGEIERTLPEIFSADYTNLVAQWKRRPVSD